MPEKLVDGIYRIKSIEDLEYIARQYDLFSGEANLKAWLRLMQKNLDSGVYKNICVEVESGQFYDWEDEYYYKSRGFEIQDFVRNSYLVELL